MGLKLLDGRAAAAVAPLAVALMYEDKFGVLPELYEIFGQDALIKFLDVFAGRHIEVPPRDILERRIRDVRIWLELGRRDEPDVTHALANEYGISTQAVREVYRTVSSYMERLHLRVESVGGCAT